ncbi:MAG: DinB family protein [Terriglobales bacterium]
MSSIEPWLRDTETDVPAVGRAVLHSFQLAEEDLRKWCENLSDAELNARPAGVAPVAFHIRHLARSLDRLLTYAEGRSLSEWQMARLLTELDAGATCDELFAELTAALADGAVRVRALARTNLEQARTVGKKQLPTSVGGLLVHVADHMQRHVGQAITTAKVVSGVYAPMPEPKKL